MNIEDKDITLSIRRYYKTGWNIAFFQSIKEFKDSLRCDEKSMAYLKAELGGLDGECDDSYSFDDFLEAYCRKCRKYEVTFGYIPEEE
jgi:hypothetical protein